MENEQIRLSLEIAKWRVYGFILGLAFIGALGLLVWRINQMLENIVIAAV